MYQQKLVTHISVRQSFKYTMAQIYHYFATHLMLKKYCQALNSIGTVAFVTGPVPCYLYILKFLFQNAEYREGNI